MNNHWNKCGAQARHYTKSFCPIFLTFHIQQVIECNQLCSLNISFIHISPLSLMPAQSTYLRSHQRDQSHNSIHHTSHLLKILYSPLILTKGETHFSQYWPNDLDLTTFPQIPSSCSTVIAWLLFMLALLLKRLVMGFQVSTSTRYSLVKQRCYFLFKVAILDSSSSYSLALMFAFPSAHYSTSNLKARSISILGSTMLNIACTWAFKKLVLNE